MWQYFLAHAAYHGVRWFPQGNRLKMSLFMVIFSIATLIPQFYIVLLERSSRWCTEPLLALAIASLVLTFFTVGFAFLFCIMIPVPRVVKIAFHVFGIAGLIIGIWQIYSMMVSADFCPETIPELYFMTQISAILSFSSIVFLAVMFPFWIINQAKKNVVLDPYTRDGICYEPVKCCSCLWHI